jgi:molecular chaperone DnaK
VSAADKATGREQQMRITPTSGLSQDEIERIINEAQTSADSDRALREKVDLNNKLTSLVRNTQRAFLEFGGSLSKESQENGQIILNEGEAAIGAAEVGAIRLALDSVDRLARQLTNAMMNQIDAAGSEEK